MIDSADTAYVARSFLILFRRAAVPHPKKRTYSWPPKNGLSQSMVEIAYGAHIPVAMPT